MSILDSINRFITLFLDTIKQFGRFRAWAILLGYFLINWLILYAHYDFTSPLFYTLVTTWTNLIDAGNADAFTHYPAQFYHLSDFYGWAKFGVGVVFEGLVLGAVASILAQR